MTHLRIGVVNVRSIDVPIKHSRVFGLLLYIKGGMRFQKMDNQLFYSDSFLKTTSY